MLSALDISFFLCCRKWQLLLATKSISFLIHEPKNNAIQLRLLGSCKQHFTFGHDSWKREDLSGELYHSTGWLILAAFASSATDSSQRTKQHSDGSAVEFLRRKSSSLKGKPHTDHQRDISTHLAPSHLLEYHQYHAVNSTLTCNRALFSWWIRFGFLGKQIERATSRRQTTLDEPVKKQQDIQCKFWYHVRQSCMKSQLCLLLKGCKIQLQGVSSCVHRKRVSLEGHVSRISFHGQCRQSSRRDMKVLLKREMLEKVSVHTCLQKTWFCAGSETTWDKSNDTRVHIARQQFRSDLKRMVTIFYFSQTHSEISISAPASFMKFLNQCSQFWFTSGKFSAADRPVNFTTTRKRPIIG